MVSLDLFTDQIDRLARRLIRNLECCDRALVACCNLTAAQAYSLLTLQELGEATMNELALEMRLHGTTMTRMVDSLVEKGLAERRQDSEDRRIVRVVPSPQGNEIIGRLQQTRREFLTAAFAGLSVEERESMVKALRHLASIADELGEKCCAS